MSKPPKTVRLERRLTRRMIQVQAVVLLLFFGVVVFPLAIYPALRFFGPTRPLDPANTTIFAEAIRTGPIGVPHVEMTRRLSDLLKDRPNAWFYAMTEAGTSVSLGDIPDYYGGLLPSLWTFQAANIRPADTDQSELQLDKHPSELGDVMVASGGGKRIGLASLVGTFWALMSIGILVILSIAAALIIPRVIRRELRGIKLHELCACGRGAEAAANAGGVPAQVIDRPVTACAFERASREVVSRNQCGDRVLAAKGMASR